MAQNQLLLKLGTPQIEMAILEAELLGGQLFTLAARDRNRRRFRRSHDAQRCGVHLDITSRELGVAHGRRTGDDLALDEQDGLGPHRLRAGHEIGRGPGRPDCDLYQSVAIAEIEKDDSSEVAAAVDPAPQPNPLPHVLFPQRAAAVGSQGGLSHAGVYAPPLSASHRMR